MKAYACLYDFYAYEYKNIGLLPLRKYKWVDQKLDRYFSVWSLATNPMQFVMLLKRLQVLVALKIEEKKTVSVEKR